VEPNLLAIQLSETLRVAGCMPCWGVSLPVFHGKLLHAKGVTPLFLKLHMICKAACLLACSPAPPSPTWMRVSARFSTARFVRPPSACAWGEE
jgi:hypothetical protein